MALRSEPLVLLLGRLCMGSLFLMSGTNHWLDLKLLTHFMGGLPGSADVWAMLAATIEVASGAAMVLGFRTREFALLLVFFNLSAAVVGHPYWSITGDASALGPVHPFLEGYRARGRRPVRLRRRRGPFQRQFKVEKPVALEGGGFTAPGT